MNVGVIRAKYNVADLKEAIKAFQEKALPAVAAHKGARSAMLLLDRSTGESISIGIYENEAAAKAFGPTAEKVLDSTKQLRHGSAAPKRELFELVASTAMETKALVERGIKNFNNHDTEAIARDLAPDVVDHVPGGLVIKGVQAAKEYDQSWISAFKDAKIEVKGIVVQGHKAVLEAVFTGTHTGTLKTEMGDIPATGKKVSGEFTQVFEIDRGLIKSRHLLFDRMQLATQLGVMPGATAAKV